VLVLLSLILVACAGQPDSQVTEQFAPTSTIDVVTPHSPTATALPAVDAPVPTGVSPTNTPEVAIAESTPSYDGIPVGVTDDGFPYLGSADAPVTLIDYSDFL